MLVRRPGVKEALCLLDSELQLSQQNRAQRRRIYPAEVDFSV